MDLHQHSSQDATNSYAYKWLFTYTWVTVLTVITQELLLQWTTPHSEKKPDETSYRTKPTTLAHMVTIPVCIPEVSDSNPCSNAILCFSSFYQIPPGNSREGTLQEVTTVSFHILSSSLIIIIISSLDGAQSKTGVHKSQHDCPNAYYVVRWPLAVFSIVIAVPFSLHHKYVSVHMHRAETTRQPWGPQVPPESWALAMELASCNPSST